MHAITRRLRWSYRCRHLRLRRREISNGGAQSIRFMALMAIGGAKVYCSSNVRRGGDLPWTMWSWGLGGMVGLGACINPPLHAFELWHTPLYDAIQNHDGSEKRIADTPSSRAVSRSRRLFSSSVTCVAPARELVRPMLVPGRAPDCDAALSKGGAVGRSGARLSGGTH